jgi:hypothetical protein
MYFFVVDAQNPAAQVADLVAPADMYVFGLSMRHYDELYGIDEPVPDFTDYDVDFALCNDVQGYFLHVRELTHQKLVPIVEGANCDFSGTSGGSDLGGGTNEQQCEIDVDEPVLIAAGEKIGTIGGRDGVAGVDMGLRDYRDPTGRSHFANPDRFCPLDKRYNWSHCYAICPFDLTDPSLAEPYLELFGARGFSRTEEPRCGDTRHDVAGTAQGYWFPESGSGDFEETYLFLGPNDLQPSVLTVSTGTSIPGISPGQYSYVPDAQDPLRLPFSAMVPGEAYCLGKLYQGGAEVIAGGGDLMTEALLLELSQDGSTLSVSRKEDGCGTAPYVLGNEVGIFQR